MKKVISICIILVMLLSSLPTFAAVENMPRYQQNPRQMEKLNRGLIAIKTSEAPSNGVNAGVALSWRLLGDENLKNQAFDIYRNNIKIHTTGSHDATYYLDKSGTEQDTYKVVKKGESPQNEVATKVWKEHAKFARGSYVNNGTSRPNAFSYIDVPIFTPPKTSTANGGTGVYYTVGETQAGANDASVGDLDGDGDYEIVLKWDPSNSKDSASGGYTSNVYIDGYEISEDNTSYMWRIDMGKNIRAGAHYTQFMVYDFDGDGKSEIAMKTAPGTIDGTGKYVTEVGDTAQIKNADNTAIHLSGKGIPTSGGEYVTIFDGETGEALYTTEGITRDAVSSWGDSKWNRSERYLAAVAYIDGVTPHFIECRGYYNAAVIRAYKWDGTTLEMVWEYKGTSGGTNSMYGQGNHNLSVGDVDLDGKDEIVYGSACLDDDGKTVLGNTRLGHGDAMHMSDFNNDGLQEVFSVKEDSNGYKTAAEHLRVAKTGETLYAIPGTADNGRGAMANVDDEYAKTHPNALAIGWSYATGDSHDMTGAVVNAKPGTNSRGMSNFFAYWDGDLSREMLDDNQLAKYDATNGWTIRFYNDGQGYLPAVSNNYSKQTPSLVADLWGDWREEIIMPIGKGEGETPYLRIMTSVIPTTYRLTTLMHDCQYRLAVAWQNVAYNQPPHTSYYIGSNALAVNGVGEVQNYLAHKVPYTVPYYVTGTAVESVRLSENEVTLKEGQTYNLKAILTPLNATKKGIIWESDDETVATVSAGNITAVGEGICQIKATTRDGGFTDYCMVTVVGIEKINSLGDAEFESSDSSFAGGIDYASLDLKESNGASFSRTFTPYYENKATISFEFNTGGRKIDGTNWNWDGHEYGFGLEFLDVYGNNIVNIAQWYKSSAEATTAKILDGDFLAIQGAWSVSGDGEEPMNRSSTTWFVTVEFDYDTNLCTVTIAGSDNLKKYTKAFSLNGRSFKTLKYWASKTGSGGITVGPSLKNLTYSLTTQKADASVQIVGIGNKTVQYLAYDKDAGEGVLIGAAYDENGALVFAERKDITLKSVPEYGQMQFARSLECYKVKLFIWKETNKLEPIGLNSVAKSRLIPVGFTASAEPAANNGGKNALDGDINTVWTSEGEHNMVLDLGEEKSISLIRLAFKKYDDKRYIPFEVAVSEDNSAWETVYSGESVPFSGDFINLNVNKTAQYVKIIAKGNSISGWNSICEVEVYGK